MSTECTMSAQGNTSAALRLCRCPIMCHSVRRRRRHKRGDRGSLRAGLFDPVLPKETQTRHGTQQPRSRRRGVLLTAMRVTPPVRPGAPLRGGDALLHPFDVGPQAVWMSTLRLATS